MADDWGDPGSLEGDELRRWYLRSPTEIDQARQSAADRQFQNFFYGPSGADPEAGAEPNEGAADGDIDPALGGSLPTSQDMDSGIAWTPVAPNRWRGMKVAGDTQSSDLDDASLAKSASYTDLAPQPVARPAGEVTGLPVKMAFGSAPRPGNALATRGRIPTVTVAASAPVGRSAGDPAIAYGALRAPAPSNEELAELRRQQAAFADATREIDLQNSWFAVPALAAPLAVMGLEGAAAWAARTALPEIEQAPLQFVEREPFRRGGDTWATQAGRRAHAAFREQVMRKAGWDSEPTITLSDGRVIRPDLRTPERLRGSNPNPKPYLMELKPDTPSGRRAAAAAVRKYEELTGLKTRPLLYNQKPFI